MTKLLQQAIAEIEKLPSAEQDALAARILSDLADEQAWTARFQATTDDQWTLLAQIVRRDIAAGEITPIEEVFPRKVSAE